MYASLAEYIDFLEKKKELIRIKEFVDPVLEITEIVDRISKTSGGGKALLFENTGTEFPLLINAWGSDNRISYALGVENVEEIPKTIDKLFTQFTGSNLNFWEKLRLLPTLGQVSTWMPKSIKNKKAPCQEVVMAKPDLNAFPILKCWPYDGGRFITLPLVHTKSLITGHRNLGMYRIQVFDENTTGVHWHRHKTGAKHFEEYKEAGKRMPVAIVLGGDPAYTWSATAPLPENLDEYLLAGFIRKRAVRLVRCLTQDIEVPEDADIVIEGFVDPTEALSTEGPFGDHTGFYSLEDFYPKFHVTCITYREGAVYPATIVGIPPQEDAYLAKATERIFLTPIRMLFAPEIKDIYLPEEGVSHNIAIASIDKTFPGQALKVANALWGAGQMMFAKIIVIVDNIAIHDIENVFTAMLKYWNPATDTYFSKGPLDVLDHAAQHPGFGGKLCIDATEKLPEETFPASGKPEERLYTFTHPEQQADLAKIIVTFDSEVDLIDFDTCVWLAANNIDVARDCKLEDGRLYIDARAKIDRSDIHRPWPNVVCMSRDIIETIDEKWERLDLGRKLTSPSLKYVSLLKSGDSRYKPLTKVTEEQQND